VCVLCDFVTFPMGMGFCACALCNAVPASRWRDIELSAGEVACCETNRWRGKLSHLLRVDLRSWADTAELVAADTGRQWLHLHTATGLCYYYNYYYYYMYVSSRSRVYCASVTRHNTLRTVMKRVYFMTVIDALEVNVNVMHSINSRFTYLLTYGVFCVERTCIVIKRCEAFQNNRHVWQFVLFDFIVFLALA